jgi:dienelactone hydrolase
MARSLRQSLTPVLLSLALQSTSGHAANFEPVALDTGSVGNGPFTAYLMRPAGQGPLPAVVAVHGCGGLLNRQGQVARREADWAQRLVAAGYAVLLTDSFTQRGMRQICTAHERSITPKDRAEDAAAAAQWLARQSWADANRLALMGWSHGAMTVLWTVRPGFMTGPLRYKTAIALYPGCREVLKQPDWKPTVPLTLLLGALDDWTPPGPCRELAARGGARIIEYPGAYHGFDAPNSPVRVRTGLARLKSGQAHVGTDPEARGAAIKDVSRILAEALGPGRK